MPALTNTANNIRVSVIIASYNSRTTIEKCLRSLVNQNTPEDFEVIIVDSSADGTADIVAQQFSKVRLFTFPERKFPGDARNFGVSKAKGELIAFTDADCLVDRNWIDQIIKAHSNDQHPIIGGSIDNGTESYMGWTFYFCEFSQWMPESPTCRMVQIPTGCLSLKRGAFAKYGPFLEGTYSSDTAFGWRAGRDGHAPLFLPSMKVSHISQSSAWNFLKRKFYRGKYFAAIRIQEQRFSILRRSAFVMIFPLLPLLLFYRVTCRILKHSRHLKKFILSSPLVFLGLTAWSCGELLGYLSKPRMSQ